MKQNASLDTSFWVHVCAAGVAQYLFDYFQVYYPDAVEREVTTPDRRYPERVYPDRKMFELMREAGYLHRQNPKQYDRRMFGAGEAQALALAKEQGYRLLIDDWRPRDYARRLGIATLSSTTFCVLLYADGKFSLQRATRAVENLRGKVANDLASRALRLLEVLGQERGDKRD